MNSFLVSYTYKISEPIGDKQWEYKDAILSADSLDSSVFLKILTEKHGTEVVLVDVVKLGE